MNDILKALQALQNTPVPIILVAAGVLFLFLAVGGQLGAKVNTDKVKQGYAAVIGILLLCGGIALYVTPFISLASTSTVTPSPTRVPTNPPTTEPINPSTLTSTPTKPIVTPLPTDTSTSTANPTKTPTPEQTATSFSITTPKPQATESAIPAGRGLLIYTNKTPHDLIIDIIGPTNISASQLPPGTQKEFILEPGYYKYNAHSPGGQFRVNTTDFEVFEGKVTTKSCCQGY